MPFAKYLQVDPTGTANHTTIGAAISAAVAGGASSSSWWTIDVNRGTYTENLTIPPGVLVRGIGPTWLHGVTIVGTVEVQSFAGLMDANVNPVTGTGWAIRLNFTTNNGYPYLSGVRARSDGNVNGLIKCVEVTGAATGAYAKVRGCYLYASNAYSGANPSGTARVAVFHVLSDVRMYVEARSGMEYKTSTTATGTAQEILVLNDCPGYSGYFGYVHAVGEWESVYGGGPAAPVPMLVKSVNTVHPGILADVGILNMGGAGVSTQVATTGLPYLYGRTVSYVDLYGYHVAPTIVRDTVPSSGEFSAMPNDALVIVTP